MCPFGFTKAAFAFVTSCVFIFFFFFVFTRFGGMQLLFNEQCINSSRKC